MPSYKHARSMIKKYLRAMRRQSPDLEELEIQVFQEPALLLDFVDILANHFRGITPLTEGELEACCLLFESGLIQMGVWLRDGYNLAKQLNDRLQKKVVKELVRDDIFEEVRGFLIQAFNFAKVPISDDFKQASRDFYYNTQVEMPDAEDNTALDSFYEEVTTSTGIASEFMFADLFIKQMHQWLDSEIQVSFVYDLLNSDKEVLRDTGALMLLHPDADVRYNVAHALLEYGDTKHISPKSLRRMILIRNWLDEETKNILDKAIKKSRKNTVTIESLKVPIHVKTLASDFDGYGLMQFFVVVKENNQFTFVKLLLNDNNGIAGASIITDLSKEGYTELLDEAKSKNHLVAVESEFLRLLVESFLARPKTDEEDVPDLSVVESLELIGLTNVYPQPRLVGHLYESYLEKPYTEGELADLEKEMFDNFVTWYRHKSFRTTWLEMGPKVQDLLEKNNVFDKEWSRETILDIIKDVIEVILQEKRQVWVNRLYWMALREHFLASKRKTKSERFFYIQAKLIEKGISLTSLPLMWEIATLTINEHLSWLLEE